MQRALAPVARAMRARRARNKRTHRPLRRARAFSRTARKNIPPKPKVGCEAIEPAAQDGISGWYLYYCPTGVLMCPNTCCPPPECRGGKPGAHKVLGFQGDIGAGTGGSFMASGRSLGVTAMDGVEIAQGLAQIQGLKESNQIDAYYAGAMRNAYLLSLSDVPLRDEPFKTPSPFAAPLAPGALGRAFRGKTGPEVGGSVQETCACTPRAPDAQDPASGWLIYYVPGGILLTPTEKCIGYYGKPSRFWGNMWSNVLNLFEGIEAVPDRPTAPPYIVDPMRQQAAPTPHPPEPKKSYLCFDPRIWPQAWRPQAGPCIPPQIEYPE